MKQLKNLDVDEISLVDVGANKKKFLIFKSQSGADNMSGKSKWAKIAKSLMGKEEQEQKTNPEITKDEGADLSEGAQAALKAVARILTPFKGEISDSDVDAVLSQLGIQESSSSEGEGDPAEMEKMKKEKEEAEQAEKMKKAKEDEEKEAAEKAKDGEEDKDGMEDLKKEFALPADVKEEHAVEALSKAKDAMNEHLEKLGYKMYPDAQVAQKSKDGEEGKESTVKSKEGDEKDDDVTKAIRKSKDANIIFKAHKELVQKNLDLEAKLAKKEKEDVKKEIVRKAASFKNLPLNQSDIVEVLESAHEMGAKQYEKVCKQYETLNTQSKTSAVFMEFGTTRSNDGKSDAEAKIDAAVGSIVKKSNGITKEKAYAEFMETDEGKKLYGEMKSERPNQI